MPFARQVPPFLILFGVLCFFNGGVVHAATHILDAEGSPIHVEIDDLTSSLTVTQKDTGTVWCQGAEVSEGKVAVSRITQLDSLNLEAQTMTAGGAGLLIKLALNPSTGDLTVAIKGDTETDLGGGLQYPYAFFPRDGSGYAVLPLFGGYLVPTTEINWLAPWSHSRMEWYGGTDKNIGGGWMYIAEPAADMQLVVSTADVNGRRRLGGSFRWLGSNANPGAHPNRLSYERRAVLHFFASGGYVAQAKHFRAYAARVGWLKSLRDKAARNPEVDRIIGAPVIYLWGDGRSVKMLSSLKKAGIEKALIQLSVNHVDQTGAFPNQQFHDNSGWADDVRKFGYVPGIYDIYEAVRAVRPNASTVQDGRRYSGFTYLWPRDSADWNYVNANGWEGLHPSVSYQMSSKFAQETRLPAHIRQFGIDAFFFDTVCALEPNEDFNHAHGHTATRAQDISNRIALLDASYGHFNKLTGTEQIQSWAVPYVHWAEGMFRLGASNARGQIGTWNNDVYPQVTTDVQDIGRQLGTVLTTGFQVPLWELVYHDDLLSVQHWHLAHNKLLYCWDFADESALIRGQAPLLNLVYAGEPGRFGRTIGQATDARDGTVWDTRWTNPAVSAHVTKTYESVCKWQEAVGYLEMTDHKTLAPDFSVQLSEFSGDGGRTGKGIVVNFGHFDGAHGMVGPNWSGEVRGRAINIPVNGFNEYAW